MSLNYHGIDKWINGNKVVTDMSLNYHGIDTWMN